MDNPSFQVNFMIVGAQKAGTTALASFLSQHPEISFAADKEVHLFDNPDFDESWTYERINNDYKKHFPDYKGQKLIGEGTPIYMYLPFIAKRISAYNQRMKLIFLLRNPVERVISQYKMEKARGHEGLPLNAAIRLEKFRLWLHRNDLSERSSLRVHSYTDRGMYARQIKNMLKYFSIRQMLFIKSEDLLNDHKNTMIKVYDFLNVRNKTFVLPTEKVFIANTKAGIDERTRKKIIKVFISDITELEKMLQWDLSGWKN